MTIRPLMPLAERPTWRGRMHAWAFAVSIPAGVLLILSAHSAAERTSASIYAATLLLVFGTSAAYHRLARTDRVRRIMQRLDHTMIYLLIAGTYVPVCLVALPRSWGIPMLSVVGVLALIGMTIKLGGFTRLQWVGYGSSSQYLSLNTSPILPNATPRSPNTGKPMASQRLTYPSQWLTYSPESPNTTSSPIQYNPEVPQYRKANGTEAS